MNQATSLRVRSDCYSSRLACGGGGGGGSSGMQVFSTFLNFFQEEGPQSKIEKECVFNCFLVFFVSRKTTSFFKRLVKTLAQNLGQIREICPRVFLPFFRKLVFTSHDTFTSSLSIKAIFGSTGS